MTTCQFTKWEWQNWISSHYFTTKQNFDHTQGTTPRTNENCAACKFSTIVDNLWYQNKLMPSDIFRISLKNDSCDSVHCAYLHTLILSAGKNAFSCHGRKEDKMSTSDKFDSDDDGAGTPFLFSWILIFSNLMIGISDNIIFICVTMDCKMLSHICNVWFKIHPDRLAAWLSTGQEANVVCILHVNENECSAFPPIVFSIFTRFPTSLLPPMAHCCCYCNTDSELMQQQPTTAAPSYVCSVVCVESVW